MRDLLTELTTALDQRRACVYCSVVETRGSTPQKAGAAMLVFADGSQRGTLGGGCVEAEVKQRAPRVLGQDSGHPEVLTFCLDDNYGWDDGLICGGRMSILADPLSGAAAAYYRTFREFAEQGREWVESGARETSREAPPVLGYVRTAVGLDAEARLAKDESFYRDMHQGYRTHFSRQGAPDGTVGVASEDAGAKKLGQPVPESNFVSDRKSSLPQPAQR